MTINGMSMEINGEIGRSVASDSNRYGRVGLTIQEAFELTYLRGMFDALVNESIAIPIRDAIVRESQGITILVPTEAQKRELLK